MGAATAAACALLSAPSRVLIRGPKPPFRIQHIDRNCMVLYIDTTYMYLEYGVDPIDIYCPIHLRYMYARHTVACKCPYVRACARARACVYAPAHTITPLYRPVSRMAGCCCDWCCSCKQRTTNSAGSAGLSRFALRSASRSTGPAVCSR